MMSISHWGMFSLDHYEIDMSWLNNGMPFIDHVFIGGKTGRETTRENLKHWVRGASA